SNLLPESDPSKKTHHQSHKVHIFLPNDYETSGSRYPVVYCFDGHSVFWHGGAFNKTVAMGNVVSWLWGEGSLARLIIVAVHPVDRELEYTDTEWAPGRAYGGLPGHAQWMVELKRWMDQSYRTDSSANRTCILGASHGGLAAFYTAMSYSDYFGLCVAYSPSFWVGQSYARLSIGAATGMAISGRPDIFSKLPSFESTSNAPRPKLVLKYGLLTSGGFRNSFVERWSAASTKKAIQVLRDEWGYEDGTDLFVSEDPNGGHDEETWK
ncbi:hypothetical protein HDU93_005463, partial [Gonapodya sp. JEL0774]